MVPGGGVEDAAAVHVYPDFLEADDAAGGEVDAAVVEVAADGEEGAAVLLFADFADVGGGVGWSRVRKAGLGFLRGWYWDLPCRAVALEMAARSPGSQSFWTSRGMVMLLAIRRGMTPLQNDRGAGFQPVQPKSCILLACMNSIAVHGAVVSYRR